MIRNMDEKGLSGWQERKAEDMVAKSALPMPIPTGLHESDENEYSISVALSPKWVLSQGERGILRR